MIVLEVIQNWPTAIVEIATLALIAFVAYMFLR